MNPVSVFHIVVWHGLHPARGRQLRQSRVEASAERRETFVAGSTADDAQDASAQLFSVRQRTVPSSAVRWYFRLFCLFALLPV